MSTLCCVFRILLGVSNFFNCSKNKLIGPSGTAESSFPRVNWCEGAMDWVLQPMANVGLQTLLSIGLGWLLVRLHVSNLEKYMPQVRC
jgi:hypothetical protein